MQKYSSIYSKKMSKKTEGFFSIGLKEWREACALGLNPAVAFLVLACGTDGSNRETNWSANSVETYGGIKSQRATVAIAMLVDAGLVKSDGNNSRPHYTLTMSEDVIWLPNSIVKGLMDQRVGERKKSAVKAIREAQDVQLLRLYVELYYSQHLAADGGLSRSVFYLEFNKTKHASYGEFVFLGFSRTAHYTAWKSELDFLHDADVLSGVAEEGGNPADAFFPRMDTLRSLGLLELSACLFESNGKDAEILFPVDGPEKSEAEIKRLADQAAEAVLPDWKLINSDFDYLVPVYRHQEKAQLYGIYRLFHRPHTQLTKAWWADLHEKITNGVEQINKVLAS